MPDKTEVSVVSDNIASSSTSTPFKTKDLLGIKPASNWGPLHKDNENTSGLKGRRTYGLTNLNALGRALSFSMPKENPQHFTNITEGHSLIGIQATMMSPPSPEESYTRPKSQALSDQSFSLPENYLLPSKIFSKHEPLQAIKSSALLPLKMESSSSEGDLDALYMAPAAEITRRSRIAENSCATPVSEDPIQLIYPAGHLPEISSTYSDLKSSSLASNDGSYQSLISHPEPGKNTRLSKNLAKSKKKNPGLYATSHTTKGELRHLFLSWIIANSHNSEQMSVQNLGTNYYRIRRDESITEQISDDFQDAHTSSSKSLYKSGTLKQVIGIDGVTGITLANGARIGRPRGPVDRYQEVYVLPYQAFDDTNILIDFQAVTASQCPCKSHCLKVDVLRAIYESVSRWRMMTSTVLKKSVQNSLCEKTSSKKACQAESIRQRDASALR